jgi:hypothetical protein
MMMLMIMICILGNNLYQKIFEVDLDSNAVEKDIGERFLIKLSKF